MHHLYHARLAKTIQHSLQSDLMLYNTCLRVQTAESLYFLQEVAKGCKRLVASSGGNAGLAAAYAVRKLCIPITVYVPSSTPQTMIDRIKGEVIFLNY